MMKKQKLGTAVFWMVCLCGVVAAVWSRPPFGSSRRSEHPRLALAAESSRQPTPAAPKPGETEAAEPVPLPAAANVSKPAGRHDVSVGLDGEWFSNWEPEANIELRFEGRRLFATLVGLIDGHRFTIRLAADVQLTKDSFLYGMITSAEVETDQDAENLEVRIWEDSIVKKILEQPFAFRYRLEENSLTIRDFKMPRVIEDDDVWTALNQFLTSRFERKNAEPAD